MTSPDEDGRDEASADAAGRPALVVGLGASAGGIQALQGFFAHVPPDGGAAFVVILHLSPEHDSRLAEVLQASSRIPVTRVTETLALEANHVYVISPSTSLRMADGMLNVSEVLRLEERRAPVDVFFRTLADVHGPRAVGIVLSGTGSDGSAGIRRLKEYGGLSIAQDPSEAAHDDMPRRAIAGGLIDYVLPVRGMWDRIAAYAPIAARPLPETADAEVPPDLLREAIAVLRARTGHDFSNYKTATLYRRIDRRRHLHGLADLQAYVHFLREHPEEPPALLKELLISVTNFFRDHRAFEALERAVVPRLFQQAGGQLHVRAWVAGCATGEEAYSVGMLLAEAAERTFAPPAIQIFATDLDAQAIAVAREGFYSDVEVADIPPERLRRFFNREAGGYRVRRELREMVLFARHNVLKDPPFSHMDLICCRNLMIYLNRPAQDRLLETFHFALRPGRFLLLGASESMSGNDGLFAIVDKDARIFESRLTPPRSIAARLDPLPAPEVPIYPVPRFQTGSLPERISPAELHFQLLEHYAPPSVVVTEDHEIVHLSARAARYLHVSPGEPTRELLKLVHGDLRVDLRTALHQASRERTTVRVSGTLSGAPVTLEVRPVLREGDPGRGFFVVLFSVDPGQGIPPAASEVAVRPSDGGADAALHLEKELLLVRHQLRATVDQYETQVEEARASNEELQTINEELRSSTEELETSKEELQSVNEELTTVNQELKIKIDELGARNNDFQNLISSTDIGTLFLDRQQRVKFFTPRVCDVFNLLPHDVGREVSDITTLLRHAELYADIERVLDTLHVAEREVQTTAGRWFLLRILPYRTVDDRIEGVVLTFQDITSRRRTEEAVRASEERLRLVIDSLEDYAIFTLAPDGAISWWNAGAARMFGFSADEIAGQHFDVLFTPEDRAAGVPAGELERARAAGRADDERWHVRKDGSRLYCSGVTTPLRDPDTMGFAKIARDLTEAREAQQALERAHGELDVRVRERTQQLELQVSERHTAEAKARGLVRQLVSAQENERARIARDIHDRVGQQLTALRFALDRVRRSCADAPAARGSLDEALEIARGIDTDIDVLARELRPAALDDLGLVAALSRYVESWGRHSGVQAEFRIDGLDDVRLTPDVETTFYRVAQEALNNVAKHAHASRADVLLERRNGAILLVVEDDGVGFDAADPSQGGGLGLSGMHERASLIGAGLQIESSPGQGTSVFLRYSPDGARA
jgi:two-component system, chemotaxis family, CheB/CheR fusion protein